MPITKRIQYRYDSVRNKIGMTDADGGLHTYTYDVMRRLTGVINPLGERTTYAYDLNGRRTSVQLANGTRTSYVYDVASRVQSVHTLKSDDSTVSKFEYAYDGNSRRTSVLEADGSRVTWTYDRISQVTAEWRTGTNPYRHTFTYDKVGNRTLKIEDGARTTLVYDACNQLATSEDAGGITSYVYDGNGNQTVVQKPNGDRTTQVWDYENRLIKTIQPSGGVTSMAYDADGLRLKLEEPTGTKLFVWDDQNYLAETDAAGTTQAAFTTEPSTYGSLISHRKAGASTTYHFDALGSTRVLTDASETVLESYNYGAFGTLLGSPTLHTPFLWGGMVGYYWDAALASQYIRARHYQPTIARWISLDPIGFAGGDANLFRYVGNSPTSGSTGMWVRLTEETYGRWQLAIARSVLDYLKFTYLNEGQRKGLQKYDPIMYPEGYSSVAGWFADNRMDPSGLAIVGTGCGEKEKAAITETVERIIQQITSSKIDCFAATNIKARDNTHSDPIKEAPCRKQLKDCILTALNMIEINCGPRSMCSVAAGGGCAIGPCADSKKFPPPKDPLRPCDTTCNSCPEDWLSLSSIMLTRGNPREGAVLVGSGENWPNKYHDPDPTYRINFARAILHEMMHHCVGPHQGIPNDSAGRPDAKVAAKDTLANCVRF